MRKFLLLITFSVVSMSILAAEKYEVSCNAVEGYEDMRIVPTGIKGNINLNNFNDTGDINVMATVEGNNNKRNYSVNVPYTKVGERIELLNDLYVSAATNVSKDEFQEFFGSFPVITCYGS